MANSYFNTFDVHAVKKALPGIFLTDIQARNILVAVSEQIGSRVKAECEKEALVVVTAIVDECGGMIRVPQAALHMPNSNVLKRMEDPKNGDYIFTTGEIKKKDV